MRINHVTELLLAAVGHSVHFALSRDTSQHSFSSIVPSYLGLHIPIVPVFESQVISSGSLKSVVYHIM